MSYPNIGPKPWLGGDRSLYEIFVGKGGTLQTRHIPSGKTLPNVIADSSVSGSLMNLVPGMQIANLGVGLATLGVSAYTAYRVHKLDKKVDALQESAARTEGKIDDLGALLEGSVNHLSQLISTNTRLLHVTLNAQKDTAEALGLLRLELAEGIDSVHQHLENAALRVEALDFSMRMNEVHGYYRRCSHQLAMGDEPNPRDLELLVERARTLESWLRSRLDLVQLGNEERYPLISALAFAVYIEMEARVLLDEGASYRSKFFAELREMIHREISEISTAWSVNRLVDHGNLLIERYVLLARTLQDHSITLVETSDGGLLPMVSEGFTHWTDEYDGVGSYMLETSMSSTPEQIALNSMKHFRAWEEVSNAPAGSAEELVPARKVIRELRLKEDVQYSERTLLKLLEEVPSARSRLRQNIDREFE